MVLLTVHLEVSVFHLLNDNLVKFTIKSFIDDYTTEEVKVEAEEGQTILEVAQDNGASLNCIFLLINSLTFSFLWW